jgi:Tol biopolymer transport system component
MPDGPASQKVAELPSKGHLGSWKEIAVYLGREIRTVQRWEKTDGLPVHRLFHSKRGSVYAFPRELDQWWESRRDALASDANPNPVLEAPPEESPIPVAVEKVPPSARSRPKWAILVVSVTLLAGLAAGWFLRNSLNFHEVRVVPVTNFPGDEETPSLSWDGTHAAFSWNGVDGRNYDIYVSKLGEGGIKRLTTAPEWDFSPSWSPSGDLIAFLRVSGLSRAEVLVINTNGGDARRIGEVRTIGASLAGKKSGLAWTRDGKGLFVSGSDSDEAEGILLMPVDGGPVRRLTLPPKGQFDLEPALSPDGRTLVFRREVGFSVSELYFLELTPELAPAAPERPLRAKPDVSAGSPTWESANTLLYLAKGRLMRATLDRDGDSNRIARDAPRDVTPGAGGCNLVAISAQPKRRGAVLCSCQRDESSVWRLDLPAETNVVPRTTRLVGGQGSALSPDGKRIAFESAMESGLNIWTAGAEGSSSRRLTFGKGATSGSPAWSPDGRWIAFDSNAADRTNVYLMPADGGESRKLTNRRADHNLPQWSRDGKRIYFATNSSGRFEVARTPAEGGEITQLTHGGGTASMESLDGSQVYYVHRGDDAWSLRRCDRDGGDDQEVIPRMIDRAFALAKDGIYFIMMPEADGRSSIRFADLKTGETRTIAQIQKPLRRAISLAPDESFLIFSQFDHWGRDLALIQDLQ